MSEQKIEDRLVAIERDVATIKRALAENQLVPGNIYNQATLAEIAAHANNALNALGSLRQRVDASHTPLLDEIKAHLVFATGSDNVTQIAARTSQGLSSLDLLRERLDVNETGAREAGTLDEIKAHLDYIRIATQDTTTDIIVGPTDVPNDMDGVTDANNPRGDRPLRETRDDLITRSR